MSSYKRSRRALARRRKQKLKNILAASACLLIVLGCGCFWALNALTPAARPAKPQVEVAAPPMTQARTASQGPQTADRVMATEAPTPAPTAAATVAPEITPEPAPTLEPVPELVMKRASALDASAYHQPVTAGADYADPDVNRLVKTTEVYREDETDDAVIDMGASDAYSTLEGVTTFRGSNYRDGGAYGEIPEEPQALMVAWQKQIRGIDTWTGVGWTGQASAVRWPADLREQMNLNRAKKAKDGLVEVLYATLDGHIYFLDLDDGQETRSPINIGAPIKGSLTVDPRGVPLLYCGQGIYEINEKKVACGTRIWSLIDQQQLYFLNGSDSKAHRHWFAFDCAPLVDGATDTMITCGENGVLYRVKLNTTQSAGRVTVDPKVTRYVYQQHGDGKLGTENSVAIYGSYAYFANNTGIIQCVDLNEMSLIWSFAMGDDTDASLVIEPEADGRVALYAVNEVDKRGSHGTSQMTKLNALTGELIWQVDSDPITQHDENGGGGFATPAVGRESLNDLVYFHICRTEHTHGMLYALNKATGEVAWAKSMEHYGWSSPTCLYTPSGKGYVLVGSSDGSLKLLDGLTGEEIARVALNANIEGSPVVFDDMIVVGTRGSVIYGVRIV